MLPRTLRRRLAGCFGMTRPVGALAVLALASTANAQYFGGYDPCNPCHTVCAPVCQQTAMIVQPTYQTVPVTEYQQVKQTVMRPVTETKYVERDVTVMRPVTEAKTVSVPVTTYQPVTEMQQVCQDRSYYTTQYVPNCRMSPCQYDSRPGLIGWMNRTGYEMRSAFTPRYTAHRQFVPNRVAVQVPVTRQVAVQGSQQVTYNVTRYEPHTTKQQVAVTETRMVAEEQTINRPVTTYRTVPVGTTMAFAPVGSFGSAVALGGTISSVAYGPIQYGSGSSATASATPDGQFQTVKPRTAENAPVPGKPSGDQKFDRNEPDDAFGDPPAAPAPTSGQTSPRGPKFCRYSDADRERLLKARRLARESEDGQERNTREFAMKKSIGNFSKGNDFDSALAMAFQRSNFTEPTSIQEMIAPADSGPHLIAPHLAAIQ